VAAVFEQPGATNHLNALQVTNPAAPLHVAADNAALLRFRGGLSPLLTVWRRLNVEVDSMQMWTGNKPEPDRIRGQGQSWTFNTYSPSPNTWSTLAMSRWVLAEIGNNPAYLGEDFYYDGLMRSSAATFAIAKSTRTSFSVTYPSASVPPPAQFQSFLN
jgi:hypothetical protein